MDTKAKVGARVRAIRRERGHSQARLGEMSGRSVETISSIERGKALPSTETLELLAAALEVHVREFFAFDNTATSIRRDALLAEINATLITLSDADLRVAADLVHTLAKHAKT